MAGIAESAIDVFFDAGTSVLMTPIWMPREAIIMNRG